MLYCYPTCFRDFKKSLSESFFSGDTDLFLSSEFSVFYFLTTDLDSVFKLTDLHFGIADYFLLFTDFFVY